MRGRIKAVQKAVGSKKEEVELWINDEHHGDHRIVTPAYEESGRDLSKKVTVEVISVDEFVREEGILDRIRFIKIDVQGYELSVCSGMIDTIDAAPEITVALEYSPEHLTDLGFEPESVLSLFRERGFSAYALNRKRSGEIMCEWDWQTMDAEGYMDILFARHPHVMA